MSSNETEQANNNGKVITSPGLDHPGVLRKYPDYVKLDEANYELFDVAYRTGQSYAQSLNSQDRETRADSIAELMQQGLAIYLTDAEGSGVKCWDSYHRTLCFLKGLVENVPELKRRLKEIPIRVYDGGDPTDKGKQNVRIMRFLAELKKLGNLTVIDSNRRLTKGRLVEALSPKLLATFDKESRPYHYWSSSALGDLPNHWLEEEKTKTYLQDTFGESKWGQLTHAEQILTLLKFQGEKTTGSPGYVDDIRAEVEREYGIKLSAIQWVHVVYMFHLPKAQYLEFKNADGSKTEQYHKAKYLPHLTKEEEKALEPVKVDLEGLFYDYHKDAVFGAVDSTGALITHAISGEVARLLIQSRELGKFYQRHKAKMDAFEALQFASLAASLALGAFGSLTLAVFIPAVVASLVLAVVFTAFAMQAKDKTQLQRCLDEKTNEIKEWERAYRRRSPDDLINDSADFSAEYVVKADPFIDAALPRTLANHPQHGDRFTHVGISNNSTVFPLTDGEAKVLAENGVEKYLAGHQPHGLGGGDTLYNIKREERPTWLGHYVNSFLNFFGLNSWVETIEPSTLLTSHRDFGSNLLGGCAILPDKLTKAVGAPIFPSVERFTAVNVVVTNNLDYDVTDPNTNQKYDAKDPNYQEVIAGLKKERDTKRERVYYSVAKGAKNSTVENARTKAIADELRSFWKDDKAQFRNTPTDQLRESKTYVEMGHQYLPVSEQIHEREYASNNNPSTSPNSKIVVDLIGKDVHTRRPVAAVYDWGNNKSPASFKMTLFATQLVEKQPELNSPNSSQYGYEIETLEGAQGRAPEF